MLGADYPYSIGHDYAHGYRGHRIRTRLSGLSAATESDMLALQLDTRAAFYDFYRDVALGVLREIDATRDWPEAGAVRRALERWDGQAGARSLGFALLIEFRQRLTSEVFAPFLGACRALDPDFSYSWHKLDMPLRKLLAARLPETLPDPVRYPDWQAFLLEVLKESAASLREGHPEVPLDRLSWGEVSRSQITHPFSARLPWLADLLDMPREPLPGCPQCVRVVYERQVPARRQRAHGGQPRPRGRRYPAPPGRAIRAPLVTALSRPVPRLVGRAGAAPGGSARGGCPDLETGGRGLGYFLAQ